MLIGLSGYAQSGKDTVGNYLVKNYGFTRVAFADALKDMAYTLNPLIDRMRWLKDEVDSLGWDQAKKHPEIRRILQVLGTECVRDIFGENAWIKVLDKKLLEMEPFKKVVITDIRFLNESKYIRNKGELWWIERKSVNPLNDHASENTLSNKNAHLIIYNNSDYVSLYHQIDMLMEREFNV